MTNLLTRLYCRLRVTHGPWAERPDHGDADEDWFECAYCGHLAKAEPEAGEYGVPWVGQVAAEERAERDSE